MDNVTQPDATDEWLDISQTESPSASNGKSISWTGTKMIVFGGKDGSLYLGDGGRYNPTTDTWASLPTLNAPSPRYLNSMTWTGSKVMVWSGYDGDPIDDGKLYDPNVDSWTNISDTNNPFQRYSHSAVWTGHSGIWTGTEMLIWGGLSNNTGKKWCKSCGMNTATQTFQLYKKN